MMDRGHDKLIKLLGCLGLVILFWIISTCNQFNATPFHNQATVIEYNGTRSKRDSHASVVSKSKPNRSEPSPIDETNQEENDSEFKDASLCEILNTKTATQWWLDHAKGIWTGVSPDHAHNQAVYDVLMPRLMHSLRNVPRLAGLQRVMDKLEKRYEFVQAGGEKSGLPIVPAVKILVLGGSVTDGGENCHNEYFTGSSCAWPARLASLLNSFTSEPLVWLISYPFGGTKTEFSTMLLRYEILPDSAKNPDIIINSHSTNDMHIVSKDEAVENDSKMLRDKVFEMTQDFHRLVLNSTCTKEQPLLVWFDDYLGNGPLNVLPSTVVNQVWQLLSNYYGTGFVSCADAVREIVYGDTHETLFSPAWYPHNESMMETQYHPGATAHVAMAYTMAYSLLQMTSYACSIPKMTPKVNPQSSEAVVFPRSPPLDTIPPPLNNNLLLDTVTDHWRHAMPRPSCDKSLRQNKRCPVGWVERAPFGQHPDQIMAYLSPYIVESGWELVSDHHKLGLVPTNGTKLVLHFSLSQPVEHMALFYMRSYGDRWKDSHVTVSLSTSNGEVHLFGSHNRRTSETYTEEIALNSASSDFTVTLDHVGGSTFKLMGLALCS